MGMYSQMASGIATQGGADWEIGLGLIGRLAAQGNYDEANRIWETILGSIAAEQVPQLEKMLAQTVPDPQMVTGGGEGRTAQASALSKLQAFVDSNGLDAQARSANQQAMSAADQRERGNREAIMASSQRRGTGGSGSELASMLQANQGSANQGRDASLDIAGQARTRALQALGQQAQIGGQMRGQDIDVESKNAAAANARDQFNSKMRYAAQGANNDYANQDFRNRMAKNSAMNSARAKQADRYTAGGQQTQRDWSGVGKGMNYKHQAAADDLEDMNF